ncbi:UV-stimulated scaffold protein A [Vombatus ursinus]|uniref:UV-stimulated scaffold protein A n=1 Tax=Vombatus ursinus TaxID=29139 RepID=A0A4X2M297_VOMUR|nr:UV-stimulated scaffold protein A [Vombatus ursinus]XP_027692450.1 UV-stimulated scaffold protein A [Vombatus ursinus]
MDQKLSQLVEDLTTSGEPQLDPEKLKEVKKICKSSEEHISHAYHLLMTQLNQEHAEIRFSAFQIVDELFTRSHQFRTLIISNFQEFLELTVETDCEQPLPPPKEVAQKLKKAALKSVTEWNEKYGDAYKKLSLGYHFLKHNKKVDFQDVSARTLAERKRDEEKQKRLESIYKERAKRTEKEMQEMSEEIEMCLTEMENCFRLLMPFDFTMRDMVEGAAAAGAFRADREALAGALNGAITYPASGLRPDDQEQPCCSKDLLPPALCLKEVGNRDWPMWSRPPEPKEVDHRECADEDDSDEEEEEEEEEEEDDDDDDDYNDDDDDDDDDSDDDGVREDFIRSHGLGSHKYSLNLEIPTDLQVHENEDNRAVVNSAMDGLKLIKNKFLPSVHSWIQLFTRAGIHDERLKRAIDLKKKLEIAVGKYKEMNIEPEGRKRKMRRALDADSDEDEDEADFVEVPEKEGYEPHIPDHLRKEYGLEPLSHPSAPRKGGGMKSGDLSSAAKPRPNEEELDPTCAAATLRVLRDRLPKFSPLSSSVSGSAPAASLGEADDSKARKLAEERARAPVMPFGMDLYYWGKEQPTAGKILKFGSQHRFWKPNETEEEVENTEMAEMLKSRSITFAGKFEPVKHKCGALMPNGSLCERQDRLKCPFHGKIIPRDECGNPINPEDKAREEKKKFEKQAQHPEWQDVEFMKEVEAATGVDLGSARYSKKGTEGKSKGKKRKYPNLTDLKQQVNTSRARIGKKVFDKGAMKRVIKAMNRMDQKKHEKFANQFNYALN